MKTSTDENVIRITEFYNSQRNRKQNTGLTVQQTADAVHVSELSSDGGPTASPCRDDASVC